MALRVLPFLKAILLGGVIAGALDISYALIFYGMLGVPATRVLQSVASGLLGTDSYAHGLSSALLGLVLHFSIAIAAAATFYAASRRFVWLIRHAVISGVVFGLCGHELHRCSTFRISAQARVPSGGARHRPARAYVRRWPADRALHTPRVPARRCADSRLMPPHA